MVCMTEHPLAITERWRVARTLSYYDGPLCSLHRTPDGRYVVYNWVDQTDVYNRWLAFEVPLPVAALITQTDTGPTRDMVADITEGALVDLDGGFQVVGVTPIKLSEMPEDLLSNAIRGMDVADRIVLWLEGPFFDDLGAS